MNKNYSLDELRERVNKAQKISIVLSQKPNFDQVAAALALGLSLEELGKTISFVCPSPMTVEFNHLVGVDRVTGKIQGTDLIVSFNYPSEQVEKVSYNDDNGKPNVVVQPKVGAPPLSEKLAIFSYAGVGADLILTVGIQNSTQLTINGQDLSQNVIVNIDSDPGNYSFGQINIIDLEASSLSEVVLGIIMGSGWPLSIDTAQNVLSGIWKNTQGLTNAKTQADTYEAVAVCLRTGALKPLPSAPSLKEDIFRPKPRMEGRPEEKPKEQPKEQSRPPSDWFEPKIFKGTSIS